MERRRPGPLPRAADTPTRGTATWPKQHGGGYSPRLPATSRGSHPRKASASIRQLSSAAGSSARTANDTAWGHRSRARPAAFVANGRVDPTGGVLSTTATHYAQQRATTRTDTAGGSSRCSAALAGRRASVGFPAGRPCVILTSRKRLAVLLSFSQAQPLSAETECYRR